MANLKSKRKNSIHPTQKVMWMTAEKLSELKAHITALIPLILRDSYPASSRILLSNSQRTCSSCCERMQMCCMWTSRHMLICFCYLLEAPLIQGFPWELAADYLFGAHVGSMPSMLWLRPIWPHFERLRFLRKEEGPSARFRFARRTPGFRGQGPNLNKFSIEVTRYRELRNMFFFLSTWISWC